jgi:ubiquinone biosynthesis protein COQ9
MLDDDPASDFGTDPTRAALLRAMLPHVPFEGWSDRAFEAAAREAEVTLGEARAAPPAARSTLPSNGTARATA